MDVRSTLRRTSTKSDRTTGDGAVGCECVEVMGVEVKGFTSSISWIRKTQVERRESRDRSARVGCIKQH